MGKTTLTCNVVSFLNLHKSKRVLLIDADPQCNATQALLHDDTCEGIYISRKPTVKTLFDYLKPIEEGDPAINVSVEPMLGTQNSFGTDLIPGHPKMSLIEDRLSSAWNDLPAGTPSGFRITNWCSQLFDHLKSRYDLVIFDVGPSLGALNRTVILSSDFLVTPFGCDIFSMLGIQNISSWIKSWKRQYDRSIGNIEEDRPGLIYEYPIVVESELKFRFAGYSVQQYVTRTFKTGRRPVKAYDRIMGQIPGTVKRYLDFLKPADLPQQDLELGHIPYLYSLVPLAQSERVPIHGLKESKKLIGNQFRQVEGYCELMDSFCKRLLKKIKDVK